jgi:hypothetical protein
MQRDILTVLGCSGTLAIALLSLPAPSSAATTAAMKTSIQTITASAHDVAERTEISLQANAITTDQTAQPLSNCTCSQCMDLSRQLLERNRSLL